MEYEHTPTVLIIDNDEGLLKAISTRIEMMGYRCITAGTGAQGMSEFEADRIDLVITDMNMPSLDGMGVIQQIRNQCDTPIIVVTGFKQAYVSALSEMHDIQILEKPFHSQDLMDAVESEIFLRQARAA